MSDAGTAPETGGSHESRHTQIAIDGTGAWLEVSISGDVDLASIPVLDAALWPFRHLEKTIVYDLDSVTFVDIAGIKPIVRQCGEGRALIRSASAPVQRLLGMLHDLGAIAIDDWWIGE